ncbi:MAG: AAA family ATPase [Nannocystis sp.]|nr:AAA family ATPase [Nannocystis sp.]
MPEVFTIDEVLHVGAVHSLYRATDRRDGRRVVLKCLDADHRSEGEASRLRREYALLRGLDLRGVVRALELREEGGELRLVLSDFGGETLAAMIEREGRLAPGRGLEIAAQLAEILGQVHAQGVIHKDIKPRNILVDQAGQVQLIDFGIAAKVTREAPSLGALGAVQGTLAYISPEQTGRMSRGVDHRSDLYSLGVTLFELFVGHPPFTAVDPAALIHAHIARLPPEPRALEPAIPRALSALILRLLAKAPEERYRGAFGVAHDLRRLAAALASEEAPEMPLGERDPPLLLQISEKKRYGRDAEAAAVAAAIARVREGGAELVLIRGPAGAGKSTLVSDLQRSAGESRLLFAAGKCDPMGRDAPYASICAAFSGLLRGLLAEGPEAAARWGWAIERSLGATAGALLPLLPELGELLRSPPPSAPSLTPEAARNRLHRAMFCLVRALARPGAPLVLFLEGIHEADRATIELVIAMLGELGSEGFCCVGSCRDAVAEGSALTEGLRTLAGWCRVTTITLGPLPAAAIAEMIADTLAITSAEALPLAEVIADKTHGSAFFAAEVLRAFDRAGVIRFDGARGAWTIDLAAAMAHPVTENVAGLLVERLRTLPAPARAALELASCVGDSFTVEAIGAVEDEALAAGLAVAAAAGLIEGGEVMRFAHDRVREAIYEAMDAPTRIGHHLALGRRWRARGGFLEDDRRLFAITEQLGLARAAITDADERRSLAILSYEAAQRARANAAFAAAIRLGTACLACLGPDPWASDYDAAFKASKLVAECEIVDGDLAAGEVMIEALLGRARGAEDQVEVILARQAIRTARHRRDLVLAGAAEASALLGEVMPTTASTAGMIFAIIKAQRAIGRRTPEDLVALPAIASRRDQLLLETFGSAASACFEGDTKLLTVISARMIALTLRHGISASAAVSLVIYGIAAGAPRRDYPLMGSYGRAALKMLDRLDEPVVKVLVCFLYSGMVQPMVQPFRECIADLREGVRRGLELGSNLMAAYCWMALTGHSVASGVNLEELRSESAAAMALLEKAKVGSVIYNSRLDRGFVLALLGESRGPGDLSYEGFDEAEIAAKMGGEVAAVSRYVWLSHSMIVNLVLGRLEVARARIRAADPGVKAVFRLFHSLSYYLAYRGITLAASAGELRWDQRLRLARELRAAIRELEKPKQSCPGNFAALQALVAAELARISGEAATAEAYERAIAAAREHGNVHVEALACERAGRYYLARGLSEAAQAYLLRARRAYMRWGAKAKVALLDGEFRELGQRRERVTSGPATIAAVSTTLTGGASSSGASSGSSRSDHMVDIASVVKAAQVFAAEIDLEALAGKMIRIVVENAGAERGALLLSEGAGLVGFAEYSTRTDALRDLGLAPLEELSELPGAVIRRALRSGQALAIEDAAVDRASAEDTYVRRRRLRSLLVAPLVVQGRRVGVIYLENNLAAGVFTAERLEVLQILAVQAAIAVEHAGFFRRLDAARAAAEAANVAKSRFLANMSHELRTPLNAILGYTELVREDAEAAGLTSVVEDLRRVSEAGDHLLGLIGEILDLTKVESGTSEFTREVIVVDALLDEIEALAAAEIVRGGNRLARERAGELGTMLGDPVRIRQILLNLLGNAAKFTEGGVITLRAAREAATLRFEVEDTGIGISEAQIATIFEPFTQADPSSTRRYGGVGLGLTICQRLCEQMGGSLEARSTVGRGSTFVVLLPVNPASRGAS